MKALESTRSWTKAVAKAVLPRDGLEQHILAATLPPILLATILYTLQHGETNEAALVVRDFVKQEAKSQCNIASVQPDTCNLVKSGQCSNLKSDGLFQYFQLYACALPALRPWLTAGIFMWLVVLFASMATAAGDFLSINLEIIVSVLGISENLAGVTIFAFGNGSSDLFSTIAAMNINNGSLAISELFGAAAFINTVVLGLVAITAPFSVGPSTFIGEVLWFIISATCLTAFLADGQLALPECLGIVGLYVAFVFYAVLRPKALHNSEVLSGTMNTNKPSQESRSSSISSQRHPDETTALLGENDSSNTQTFADASSSAIHDESSIVNNESSRLYTTRLTQTSSNNNVSTIAQLTNPEHTTTKVGIFESILNMAPPIMTWKEQTAGQKFLTAFSIPLLVPIGLTTPIIIEDKKEEGVCSDVAVHRNADATASDILEESEHADNRAPSSSPAGKQRAYWQCLVQNWPLYLQVLVGSQLLAWVLMSQTGTIPETPTNYLKTCISALTLSIALITFHLISHRSPTSTSKPLSRISALSMALFGFTTSMTWIYLIATEAVSVLTMLGSVLRIPTAILGAVIFAIGNSSNDLVANTAVARRGYPVLAASACFGGPMMNMLLGIGGGGLVQVLKQNASGGKPRMYTFNVSPSLFVSAANLLVGLVVTLVYAFVSGWRLDRRFGVVLIAIWSVFTAGNVLVSMLGY